MPMEFSYAIFQSHDFMVMNRRNKLGLRHCQDGYLKLGDFFLGNNHRGINFSVYITFMVITY